MTDRIYLSLWLRGYSQATMLRSLERAIGQFPVSIFHRAAVLRIYALDLVEPAISEQHFEEAQAEEIASAARDFENPDCAYDVELHWDLWQRDESWSLTPSPVRITCFGPGFPSDLGEHLLVDFGFEYLFLPGEKQDRNWTALQSNIRSLLRLVSEWEEILPISKRSLWSDSGEDLAERIEEALEQ